MGTDGNSLLNKCGDAVVDSIPLEVLVVCPNASIPEQTKGILKFYPNPAKNKITFEFVRNFRSDLKIAIFDVLGKKVAAIDQIYHPRFIWDCSALPKGLYIVQVEQGKSIVNTKKLFLE